LCRISPAIAVPGAFRWLDRNAALRGDLRDRLAGCGQFGRLTAESCDPPQSHIAVGRTDLDPESGSAQSFRRGHRAQDHFLTIF
jgi:hypothetical protein